MDGIPELLRAARVSGQVATQWLDPLEAAATRFDINTRLRQIHWLATLIHESAGFAVFEEDLNYSAATLLRLWPSRFTAQQAAEYARKPERIANRIYANRMGNGPEATGDGWRYRGMGPIQLTGAANRLACGKALGLDLIGQPRLLLEPATGALSAGWYWQTNRCNELADADDIEGIRRRVNGGTIGLQEVARLVAMMKLS